MSNFTFTSDSGDEPAEEEVHASKGPVPSTPERSTATMPPTSHGEDASAQKQSRGCTEEIAVECDADNQKSQTSNLAAGFQNQDSQTISRVVDTGKRELQLTNIVEQLQPLMKDMIVDGSRQHKSQLEEFSEKILSQLHSGSEDEATKTSAQKQISELKELIKEEAASRKESDQRVESRLIGISHVLVGLKVQMEVLRKDAAPPAQATQEALQSLQSLGQADLASALDPANNATNFPGTGVALKDPITQPVSIAEEIGEHSMESHITREQIIPRGTPDLFEPYLEIDIKIGRILSNDENVGHHLIIPDPLDDYRLLILGVNITSVKRKLEALQTDSSFTIEAIDVDVDETTQLPHYFTPLVNFTSTKEELVDFDDGSVQGEGNRKCQLVLLGDHVNNREGLPVTTPSYYGVTVAHAFLNKSQVDCLRANDDDKMFLSVTNQMLRSNWNVRWWMRQNETRLQIVGAPLIKIRDHFLDRDEFMQDIALCEVMREELRQCRLLDVDAIHSEEVEALLTFGSHDRRYIIGGIFPIASRKDIDAIAHKKVLVETENGIVEGIIGRPARTSNETLQRRGPVPHYGLHIGFTTVNNHSFESGSSGSIVYVVGKDNKYVYIIGMLTAVCSEKCDYYQAIVLHSCLKDLVKDNITKVRNVEPLRNVRGPAYGDPDSLQSGTRQRTTRGRSANT